MLDPGYKSTQAGKKEEEREQRAAGLKKYCLQHKCFKDCQ